MRQHNNLIPRQPDIRLDSMGTYIHRRGERSKRVFWEICAVPSVRDGLWQFDSAIVPRFLGRASGSERICRCDFGLGCQHLNLWRERR